MNLEECISRFFARFEVLLLKVDDTGSKDCTLR